MSGKGKPELRPISGGLLEALNLCGRRVVLEIRRSVSSRLKPDGSAQKQNAASTIARKGHDHPVIEKRARFTKEGTYRVTPRDDASVMIAIASPADSEVAARLEKNGYDFFGVTAAADAAAYDIMDKYLTEAVDKAFQEGRS